MTLVATSHGAASRRDEFQIQVPHRPPARYAGLRSRQTLQACTAPLGIKGSLASDPFWPDAEPLSPPSLVVFLGLLPAGAVDLFALWIQHRDGRRASLVHPDPYAWTALDIGDHKLGILVFVSERDALDAL